MGDSDERDGRGQADKQRRRRVPRWTIAFLRALERCGEVRAAAEDSGIDHSTAYARRRSHEEFAAAWAAALDAHARRRAETTEPLRPAPPVAATGETLIAGGQVRRAGPGRWSAARERAFLEALAGEANVKRAAAAAGVSPQALYRRRLKDRHFAAAWDCAVELGKVRLHALLVALAERQFDPDSLPVGEGEPRISAAEGLRLLALGGGPARAVEPEPDEERAFGGKTHDEACQSIIGRLERLNARHRAEKEAEGWTWCEEHDSLIPPGWSRQAP